MSKNSIIDHQVEVEQRRIDYIEEITLLKDNILNKSNLFTISREIRLKNRKFLNYKGSARVYG